MFFGLDSVTMMYMAAAAASLAAMTFTYYFTKNGIPSLNLKAEDLQLMTKGAIKGALHTADLDDIIKCIDKPEGVMSKIESAMSRFNVEKVGVTEVQSSLQDLGLAFSSLYSAVRFCDHQIKPKHIEILSKMAQAFEKPEDLVAEMGKNVVVNGVDIYRELNAAYSNYLGALYEDFGRDIGVALALVFIGSNSGANLDPKSQQVMMSYAQGQLYPSLTQNIYDSDDNTAYLNFLEYIALKSQNPESSIQKPAGPQKIKIIDLPETHNLEIAEIPEYIDGDAFYDAREGHERLLSLMSINQVNDLY